MPKMPYTRSISPIGSNGNIRYQLKTPYRESLPHERNECFGYGTTHVIFEPLDCIEDPVVINQTLGHLRDKAETTAHTLLPESRAPPAGLFG
jgi:hypothetical protein